MKKCKSYSSEMTLENKKDVGQSPSDPEAPPSAHIPNKEAHAVT